MKVLKWIFTGLVLLGASYAAFTWWNNRHYFEAGTKGNFAIGVGDTFWFQLSENGSTGYQNCWINQSQCTKVEFVDKSYASSLQKELGYIGSGGRVIFTFKGVRKGVDTIALASCPTGRYGKDCGQFSIDSLAPDNLFIVNVR